MTRIGIDIGGTFTDVVAEVDGHFYSAKVPSTRPNPDEAVSAAVDVILDRSGASPESVIGVSHGTTVATNAAIQGNFASVGFLTTAGFADVLAVGRQTRDGLYNLLFRGRRVIVPENMRAEVNERMDAKGISLLLPDKKKVLATARTLLDGGAQVLCIGFLHSYVNSDHEKLVADWITEAFPEIPVWTSAEVAPEFREYERFSTAVLDAALGPLMAQYLHRFSERVKHARIDAEPLLMHSAGGLSTLDDAGNHPTMTLLSGPAAGVLGTIEMGRRLNRRELLTFDMGGTSADLSLIHNGEPAELRLRHVEGIPVLGNCLDISTIGAGGGSIAWVDTGGRLRVGPNSAGARPGPAAYGHGGTEPTVTDALVLVGLIPANLELGSTISIDYDGALSAMRSVAKQLNLDPVEAARAILDVVNTNMSLTARKIILERGLDPRDFTLVAYGGAGPMHAVDVARELGISEVLIPATPGTMCALGLLVSDQESEFVSSQILELHEKNISTIDEIGNELILKAEKWIQEQAVSGNDHSFSLQGDMRYRGQHHSLTVDIPYLPLTPEGVETARRRFIEAHQSQNGYAAEDESIELVNLRLRAVVPLLRSTGEAPQLKYSQQETKSNKLGSQSVEIWWDREERISTPIYHRSQFSSGDEVEGPALVFQEDTTIAVPPRTNFTALEDGTAAIQLLDSHETNSSSILEAAQL